MISSCTGRCASGPGARKCHEHHSAADLLERACAHVLFDTFFSPFPLETPTSDEGLSTLPAVPGWLWNKLSRACFRDVDSRKYRELPGSTGSASSDSALYAQPPGREGGRSFGGDRLTLALSIPTARRT